MVQLILSLFFLLPALSSAATVEQFGFSRFGFPLTWDVSQSQFPKVIADLTPTGTLSLAEPGPMTTLNPFDADAPKALHDLVYESLLLPDPIYSSDQLYPLLAKAVRYTDDLSTVTFELDPDARFQNGDPLTGDDVVSAWREWAQHDPEVKSLLAKIRIQTDAHSVTLKLNASPQLNRQTVMRLAQGPIVKHGPNAALLGTGPYRLIASGPKNLTLVKDPNYWGQQIPTRRGFFNFNKVEIDRYGDAAAARDAIEKSHDGFYLESDPEMVPILANYFQTRKTPVQMMTAARSTVGKKMKMLAFNLSRLQDVRVRQAIILAYDFDQLNKDQFAGNLKRPDSLLFESQWEPHGWPSVQVSDLLQNCGRALPDQAFDGFESYGNAKATQFPDHTSRLLAAMGLLQKAGYGLVNSKLRRLSDGAKAAPVTLKIAVPSADWFVQLSGFEHSLEKLGFVVDFESGVDVKDYDLKLVSQTMLSRGGWPRADAAQEIFGPGNPNHLQLACATKLVQSMMTTPPASQTYTDAAEALARLQQALALGIFLGEPAMRTYFVDHRIQVPTGLSISHADLYGFWYAP